VDAVARHVEQVTGRESCREVGITTALTLTIVLDVCPPLPRAAQDPSPKLPAGAVARRTISSTTASSGAVASMRIPRVGVSSLEGAGV
jgi:hypothetical protein